MTHNRQGMDGTLECRSAVTPSQKKPKLSAAEKLHTVVSIQGRRRCLSSFAGDSWDGTLSAMRTTSQWECLVFLVGAMSLMAGRWAIRQWVPVRFHPFTKKIWKLAKHERSV